MMRSTKIAAIFILLSLGLLGQMLSPPDGLAQGQQEDTIVYSTDGTTIMEAKGTIIKESFKGVELKTRKFKLNEIKNIKYANQPYKYFNAQNSQSQREYDKAIKVYQEILEDIKSSKTRALFKQHMLFNIARCYQSDRKFGQAVKAYEHLLKEIPDTRYFREAYENIAQCYLAQKDITKAVAAMVEARKQGSAAGLDQESLLKFDLLKANILENNGQPDQAQPLYANISQQATNLPDIAAIAMVGQGRCYITAHKDYGKAKKIFESVISQYKSFEARAGAYNGLGDCNFQEANNGQDPTMYKKPLFNYLRSYLMYPPPDNGSTFEAEKAMFQAGQCFKKLSKSLPKEKRKIYKNYAHGLYDDLKNRYPNSPWIKKIK